MPFYVIETGGFRSIPVEAETGLEAAVALIQKEPPPNTGELISVSFAEGRRRTAYASVAGVLRQAQVIDLYFLTRRGCYVLNEFRGGDSILAERFPSWTPLPEVN